MRIQYRPEGGAIVAYGQFDAPQDGCALAEVADDAPLREPGEKFWRDGRIVVVSPPAPTAEEVVAREAEEGADRDAGDRLRAAMAGLADAEARLTDGATLTLAVARPILLMLVRVQRAQLRLLIRRGLV